MRSGRIWVAWLVLSAYFVGAAALVFWPVKVGEGAVVNLAAALHKDQQKLLSVLEPLANVAFFVPIGALLFWGLARWWAALILALAVSCFIEVVQAILLPGRVASLGDVCANAAGAFIGICAAGLVDWVRRRRVRGPTRSSSAVW
ncbi:VanZ family protein [Microbacterium sp. P26]|uniref:VanZ family protein n=1 Tax=Microbacterium TaxID=33882 RepID=UPI00203A7E7C|nr:VanZ family protein [Microbacterium sp. P26]MCM3503436.1 VanZ family protein [Microbacterium sp. P26]